MEFPALRPGLVGGHCIGVDPYYLTYKAESLGYHPQVILAGRRINDNMGAFVAGKVVKLLTRHGKPVNGSRALILGLTFKENCADIRNSRVLDIIQELNEFGVSTDIYDPLADAAEVQAMYELNLLLSLDNVSPYDAVVLAVAHDAFTETSFQTRIRSLGELVYDVKGCLTKGLPMEDYSSHRFLVTGGAGFIGSHLVDALLARGAEFVRVLDDFSNGQRVNLAMHASNPRLEIWEGSIADAALCEQACAGITHISHQAALGSVPRSLAEPERFVAVNVGGFGNVLEAARKAGVRRVVFASSSSVYGDEKTLPKVEERIGKPLSPYALTKQINEQQAALWGRLYGLETIGLRYFNVFGPRQRPDGPYAAVLPRMITAAQFGEAPTLFGDGEQTRDFTYVANVVQANLLALTTTNPKPRSAGPFWAGLQRRNGSANLAQRGWGVVQQLTGNTIAPIYAPERAGDIRHSLADIGKIQRQLGYEVSVGFAEGISHTILSAVPQ